MARHNGTVLVDTNVILECWRIDAWRALADRYDVETVEDCVTETQTGFQRRRREQQIDQTVLTKSLKAVHKVSDRELAAVLVRDVTVSNLDIGERSLWAHALTRSDAWVLCGPDKASLRFGVRLGFRDRLVALDGLLNDVGHRPKVPLKEPYTSAWSAKTLGELVILEGPRKQ